MNFAIRYPSRLDKYIACDCNAASSDNNSKAWVARVSLARSEGGWSELASRTVERWFSAASLESQTKAVSDVRRMILCASVDGYVGCVAALCDFNLTEKAKGIQIPGLYVVGKCDGVLTEAKFAQAIPQASFVGIAGAGHLPMVEQSEAFVTVIRDFLGSS